MDKPAFQPGRLLMTRGIQSLLERNPAAAAVVNACLSRHLAGDCGDMTEEDVLANCRAIVTGGERVFSAYETTAGRLWVITEADRSATTILFPDEY